MTWLYLREIQRKLVSAGSFNTKITHPPHISRGPLFEFAKRKLIPTHHAISTVESDININDLSTKEPVVRCDNATSSFFKYRCEFVSSDKETIIMPIFLSIELE